MKLLKLISILLIITSCAGPTNPFGGDIFISEDFTLDKGFKSEHVKMTFSPGRQYYNSPYDLKINLIDPNFNIRHFKYEIIYNNKKLNRWFKTEEIKFPKIKTAPIEITFKNLSILPGNINKIMFLYYPVGSQIPITHKLSVPECFKEFQPETLNITPFQITKVLQNNIKTLSNKYNYNPSLVAALIAQESSFNPKAVSFARALGLTQVTPTAHQEIQRYKKEWFIYPKFQDLSFSKIKKNLKKNKINAKNDWRLDEKKSIEGGIIYLNYLQSYWATPDKTEILSEAFQNDVPKIDILLASYNSGAYRVKKSILKNKEDWLFDKSLKEARKYVMNIKSYCYSFNEDINHEK